MNTQNDLLQVDVAGYKGKNQIGFNLLLWSAAVSRDLEPVAARLREIGYDGVELSLSETATAPYASFGKYLRATGLNASVVMALDAQADPVDPSPAVRNRAVEKLKWGVDRAQDLGAKIICGPVHSAFANFKKRPPTADEYKWSAEVLREAAEYASQADVTFAVEAINRFECYLCNTVQQLNHLLSLVQHPNMRAMFDTHHANIEEKNVSKALQSLSQKPAHVHISENDRGTPGDGHIAFDKVFETLAEISYNGWLTIDAFSRQDENFANSINVWREYSRPWDVAEKGLSFIRMMQKKYGL